MPSKKGTTNAKPTVAEDTKVATRKTTRATSPKSATRVPVRVAEVKRRKRARNNVRADDRAPNDGSDKLESAAQVSSVSSIPRVLQYSRHDGADRYQRNKPIILTKAAAAHLMGESGRAPSDTQALYARPVWWKEEIAMLLVACLALVPVGAVLGLAAAGAGLVFFLAGVATHLWVWRSHDE